jgi:ubiquinone/menaquinone biosynthesis C-methylase UbiE
VGLDWASLPPGSTIVDVGGGIGSTSMQLAQAFGHLRFVVQDRAVVVDMGIKVRSSRSPLYLVVCCVVCDGG